jgi:threonine synthase
MAVAVSDAEMDEGAGSLARTAGVLACPEGGATLAALRRLRHDGVIGCGDSVVIFNTGTGLKYLDTASAPGPR